MKNIPMIFLSSILWLATQVAFGMGEHVLLRAAREGDADKVYQLLTDGADANMKGFFFGWSPLHWAASFDRGEVVKLLLQYGGANVNQQSSTGETPIQLAILKKHFDMARQLIGYGAELKMPEEPKECCICFSEKELCVFPCSNKHSEEICDDCLMLVNNLCPLCREDWGKR